MSLKLLVSLAAVAGLSLVGAYALVRAPGYMLFGQSIPRVETAEPVVAFTFDDGPISGDTERLLEVLSRHECPATFFVVGRSAEREPELLSRVVAAGHEIGNHAWEHDYLLLRFPSEIEESIRKTDAVIRASGYRGEIPFRAPFDAKFVMLPWVLSTMDRPNISTNVMAWPREHRGATTDEIVDSIMESIAPGSIVTLHDWGDHTAVAMDRILTQVRERGLRCLRVSELAARR